MKSYFYLLLCGVLLACQAPKSAESGKTKVYLLGTFHFGQSDTTVFDAKTAERQREIQEVTSIIEALKPDKVFIERMPDFEYQNNMDSLYKAYCNGDTLKRRNEIWQIAFRVASHLNHPAIYQCDHPGRYGALYTAIEDFAKQHDQEHILDYESPGTTVPPHMLHNSDSILHANTLKEYLSFLNSPLYLGTSHASYINTYPQIGNTNVYEYDENYLLGTELTTDWYRRNIMIYSKMINQLNYSEKSIFLIIGSDHVPILQHLFQSNPYFEVVNTEQWLGKSTISESLIQQDLKR